MFYLYSAFQVRTLTRNTEVQAKYCTAIRTSSQTCKHTAWQIMTSVLKYQLQNYVNKLVFEVWSDEILNAQKLTV